MRDNEMRRSGWVDAPNEPQRGGPRVIIPEGLSGPVRIKKQTPQRGLTKEELSRVAENYRRLTLRGR